MTEITMHTFLEGMNKDLDKSLISERAYLDALNMRAITTEGNTTGSLENVRGTRQLSPVLSNAATLVVGATYYVYSGVAIHATVEYAKGTYFVATTTTFTGTGLIIETPIEDQQIIGGVTIRDTVVIFTTNNTTDTPIRGRSCIYTVQVVVEDEILNNNPTAVWKKIYDDNLNIGLAASDFLNFSTIYPIKAIARYETQNIQKIYWTDGYNTVRYIDIAKHQTITGESYSTSNRYNTSDKFNLQPNFSFSKPVLSDIITGTLQAGIVQYTYQLYELNGPETTYAPLGDIIHLTNSNDFGSDDRTYEGADSPDINTGKGIRVKVVNNDTGFDRARLIRIYYPTLNATPSINVVSEVDIPSDNTDFYLSDTGSTLGTLAPYELVNISNTELFIAQDLATKDNRLFAANIKDTVFKIEDYDSRVIRYKNYTEISGSGLTDSIGRHTGTMNNSRVSAIYRGINFVEVTITNVSSFLNVDSSRSITNITSIDVSGLDVEYLNSGRDIVDTLIDNPFYILVTALVYTAGTDTLSFEVSNTGPGQLFTDFQSLEYVELNVVTYHYTYDALGTAVINAKVQDANLGERAFEVPTNRAILADWDIAGWNLYETEHDGINEFNNPTNAYDQSKWYKYQSDGSTLGAEGPNIKIGFTTESFILDDPASSNEGYYSILKGIVDNQSYENYSSPYRTGKKSFQRGEVYRLWAVYHNDKGQASFPQWMCDLKFPSISDVNFNLTTYTAETIRGVSLYPTVTFRSLPVGATSVQIYMTPRGSQDRSVYSQGLGQLISIGKPPQPLALDSSSNNSPHGIKLITPEISYNKSLRTSTSDYIEYLGSYSYIASTEPTILPSARIYKCTSLTQARGVEQDVVGIDVSKIVIPANADVPQGFGIFSDAINYNNVFLNSYGCTGLMIQTSTINWNGIDKRFSLVNYRKNVFNSQYGGNKYENRSINSCYAISDIINTIGSPITIYGGDTFINMFEAAPFLFDLAQNSTNSKAVTLFMPVESTINLDLSHGDSLRPRTILSNPTTWFYRQEVSSDMEGWKAYGATTGYVQTKDMYLYNTVYSQQPTLGYKFAKPSDFTENTEFDTMIKASELKTNAELSDSWSKFLPNNFIEVDSKHGVLNAIVTYNNQLLYLQDYGFGVVAVNDRSLIQDASGAQLVLGSGGILDRYDYISDKFGSKDKFSVVVSKAGMYWFDRIHKSFVRFTTGKVEDLSRVNYIKSYLDENYKSSHKTIACTDDQNDEVLFTLHNDNIDESFTLGFSETLNSFVSFYSFLPNIYIPFHERVLSTTPSKSNFLFLHNSNKANRCNFYGYIDDDYETFYDSTLRILFNPEYESTKVFDNIVMVTNVYQEGIDIYDKTFDKVIFYNDYQCTGPIDLIYKNTLERRERTWNLFIPRNIVSTVLDAHANILDNTNWDITRSFKERMRDRYLIAEFTYTNNDTKDKLVVSKIGAKYRKSFR